MPELHRVAAPVYRAAIERAEDLDAALLARGQALESAGYYQQVKSDGVFGIAFHVARGRTHGRSTAGMGRTMLWSSPSAAKKERRSFRPLNCWIASLQRRKTSVPTCSCGRSCRIIFCPRWPTQAELPRRHILRRWAQSMKKFHGPGDTDRASFLSNAGRAQECSAGWGSTASQCGKYSTGLSASPDAGCANSASRFAGRLRTREPVGRRIFFRTEGSAGQTRSDAS